MTMMMTTAMTMTKMATTTTIDPRQTATGRAGRYQRGVVMARSGLSASIVSLLVITLGLPASPLVAGEITPAQKKADQRFADLLASAKKDRTKTDWKVLRNAFAESSHYNPDSFMWREEIDRLEDTIEKGDDKKTAAMFGMLLERDGFMRLDALVLAVKFYEKAGQKEKARVCREFVEGLTSAILIPGAGFAVEKPIEVLFIEEEYFVLQTLKVKVKQQSLVERDGHRFDVFTPQPQEGRPLRMLYFNIDRPYKAFSKSTDKLLDEAGALDLDK